MDRARILNKIAAFPIRAKTLARDMRSGAYRSVFRGNGIEFDEVRDYRPGDDVRYIDRNVSARFGRPFVKLYKEEREFSLCVLLDCSLSMLERGADNISRLEQAVLVLALLGFSAESAKQRFGAIFFDNEVREVWQCRTGLSNLFAMIDAACAMDEQPERGRDTGLADALRRVQKLCNRRSLVVIVSDFLKAAWEDELAKVSQVHDIICAHIALPAEYDFPVSGQVVIEDMESAKTVRAAAGAALKESWEAFFKQRENNWKETCLRHGAAPITILTSEEPAACLSRFLGKRRRA